jgi:hypothetical protein
MQGARAENQVLCFLKMIKFWFLRRLALGNGWENMRQKSYKR